MIMKHLGSMAVYIPLSLAVRPLTDGGVSHKISLARVVTARLLTTIVTMSGADTVFSPTANRAFRQRVLLNAAKFLEDGYLEIKHHAWELVKFLIAEGEDFESVFCNEASSNTSRRTGKMIT
jgi:hypothetical protein